MVQQLQQTSRLLKLPQKFLHCRHSLKRYPMEYLFMVTLYQIYPTHRGTLIAEELTGENDLLYGLEKLPGIKE